MAYFVYIAFFGVLLFLGFAKHAPVFYFIAVLILSIWGSLFGVACDLRKQLGRTSDLSFQWFRDAMAGGRDPGFLVATFTHIIFPFWEMSHRLFGDPDPLPHQIPEPPPPVIPTLDTEAIVAELDKDIATVYPNLTDFREKMIAGFRIFFKLDYTTPQQTNEEWENRVADAQQHAAFKLRDFVKQIHGALPKSPPQTLFVTSLYELISVRLLDGAISGIKDTFPNTYHRFLHWSDWGRALSGSAQNRVKEALHLDGFERNSAEHVRYVMKEFHPMVDGIVPIGIPERSRFRGTWIIAPPDRGKTTLLSAMLGIDMDTVRKNGATVIVFDSKGDLSNHLRRQKEFAPGGMLHGKLTLIEPSPTLSINPLDLGANTAHTIGLIEYIFTSLFADETSSKQLFLLRKLIIACQGIPGGNLFTMREMLQQNGWRKYEADVNKLDELTRDYFLSGAIDEPRTKETKEALFWKIDDLITRVPNISNMYRARKTKIDMAEQMDTARVVIVDNSKAVLSKSGSEFFSRLFIALILQAAQQRSNRDDKDKLPVYVYLDEAHDVIAHDENIATILQQCRSQKIGMIFAHQSVSQIKSPEVKAALFDCGVRIANSDAEAGILADSFRWPEQEMRSLQVGTFALFVKDYLDPGLKVYAPDLPASQWKKMTDEEFAGIQADMAARFHQDITFPESEVVYPIAAEDAPDTGPKPWKPA